VGVRASENWSFKSIRIEELESLRSGELEEELAEELSVEGSRLFNGRIGNFFLLKLMKFESLS
jgi:hypothetical protein